MEWPWEKWRSLGKAAPGDDGLALTSNLTITRFKVSMDPVAAKSSFLCMYMSSHKDTLASYVIHHGKVANTKITNAEMTKIDSKVRFHSRKFRPPCSLIPLST